MSKRTRRPTLSQTDSEKKLVFPGLHLTDAKLLKERHKDSLQHQQATGWESSTSWVDKEMTKGSLAAFHSDNYTPSNVEKKCFNNLQPSGVVVYVLCKVCRKQKNRSTSNFSSRSDFTISLLEQNGAPEVHKTSHCTGSIVEDFDYSDFRFQIWPCSSCGTLIKVKSEDTIVGSGSDARKSSKKGKLRKRLSKMHKTLRSSRGASPEISEDLSNTSAIENDRSVTSNHVTPSHSRSASNTSRSQFSYNGSDYEGCDVVEYNDCNGQYLVVKQRSIAGSDIDYNTRQIELQPEATDTETVGSISSPADRLCFTPTGERGNISISSAGTRSTDKSGLIRTRTTPSSLVKETEASNRQCQLKSASASSLSNSYLKDLEFSTENKISLHQNFDSSSTQENSFSEVAVSYKSRDGTLFLPIPEPHSYKMTKQGVRKKKRSPSWYNVLSQSYKQKNDDFHKFFSDLPETERLVVDYTCAWIKDILVQGRMYVSQNYVCFYSNILKWQTVTVMSFKDIQHVTKEKTVKLFPNAIQFQTDGHDKPKTFTSFTQRDRAFHQITKLWHNALADKPMTPQELWEKVHHNYGSELGCSSDEDYVRPGSETPTPEAKISNDKKTKRKKKATSTHLSENGKEKSNLSRKTDTESEQLNRAMPGDQFSDEGKTSSRESNEDPLVDSMETSGENYDPVAHCKEDLRRTYLSREYSVSAAVMYHTLFGDDSNFMFDYLEGKGSLDIVVGKWEDGEDEDQKIRQLHYCLPLNNPLVPKLSKVEEKQVYLKESEDGKCYAVDSYAHMRGAPYTEYFVTVMRYSIRQIDKNVCELRVTAEVNYKKHPWGFVKSFIEKNVVSGMNDNFSFLERELDRFFVRRGHLQTPSFSPTSYLRRRQRNSTSSSEQKESKYSTSSDPAVGGDAQSSPLPQNGDIPNHVHSIDKDIKAAPTTSPLAVPDDVGGSGALNDKPHLAETQWFKWMIISLVIIFFLLIWSNYTMNRRLALLETLHSRSVPSQFDYPAHNDINDVYDVGGTNDVSVVKKLANLERRLARIEAIVQDHVTLSGRLQEEMQNTLNEISDSVKT